MFEDFFTTYSMVEPPKIYKDNPNLIIEKIKEKGDIISPVTLNTLDISDTNQLNYPGIRSPFDNTVNTDQTMNLPSNNQDLQSPTILKGTPDFERILDEAQKINPEVEKYRDFLIKTAQRESGFDSYVQNKAGAPYYGYFQMGKEEIKRTTGLSVEEFRSNPVQQILGAVKLYKMNLKTIKALGIYNLGKDKGYSDDALVAGAWMGGPGGVKKYLLGQGDPSDSHWYGGKGGSSVGKIMNNWKEK